MQEILIKKNRKKEKKKILNQKGRKEKETLKANDLSKWEEEEFNQSL